MSTSAQPMPFYRPDTGAVPDVAPSAGSVQRPWIGEAWKNIGGYVAAIALSLAVMTATLRLWRADLTVPMAYLSDGLMGQMFVENILETGWFLDNDRLGAPYSQDLRDYPMADALHFAVLKLLGCFSHNSAWILNVFTLLSFPLTALSAHFALRRLGLGRVAALSASVLYTCMPYHFLRSQGHFFLAAYYLLPPMLWIVVRVYLGKNPFLALDPTAGKPRWRFLRWEAIGVALLCVLTGLAGVYYAFFTCFLLLMAGVRAALRERRGAHLAATGLLIVLIAGAVAAALAPSILYRIHNGVNPVVAARFPSEADTYGLQVSEMLLPVVGHRIPYLAALQARFLAPPRPFAGEAWSTVLGVLGSAGFLLLIGRFVWLRGRSVERIEDGLAYLTFSAVMLGTIGGVGSWFSFYISPMIRCYNRISILIAFFALAGLYLTLERVVQRRLKAAWARNAFSVALLGLLALGVIDQASPAFIPNYAADKKEYAADEEFGKRMEAALPPGAMVYEMPDFPFPEAGPVQQLGMYQLMRPFLHTRTLHWSYAGMVGRDAGRWSMVLAARPLPEAVEQLAHAGFLGIYLDRAGFADNGTAVEANLTELLGAPPLVSGTNRQVFFDMTAYVAALRAGFTDDEWEARRDAAVHPMALRWALPTGEPDQGADGQNWRWCGSKALLFVGNFTGRPRRVVFQMDYSGWHNAPHRLALDGDLCRRELSLVTERQHLELEVVVPPGEHVLSFTCDGPLLVAPADPREKVFQLWNFEQRIAD